MGGATRQGPAGPPAKGWHALAAAVITVSVLSSVAGLAVLGFWAWGAIAGEGGPVAVTRPAPEPPAPVTREPVTRVVEKPPQPVARTVAEPVAPPISPPPVAPSPPAVAPVILASSSHASDRFTLREPPAPEPVPYILPEKPWFALASLEGADASEAPSDTVCAADRSLNTALKWAKSPEEAAEQARNSGNLLFLIHVSGNFEDPGFT